MIYATDLDRTLIFSKKFLAPLAGNTPVVCVEDHDGREISYMTVQALEKLNNLKAETSLHIIPTTTRSIMQYKQVTAVQGCEYAVTTNGGVILCNGERLVDWDNIVSEKLKGYVPEYEKMLDFVSPLEQYFDREFKLVDSVFYYTVLKEGTLEVVSEYLDSNLNSDLWTYTIQGVKLYIIPKDISKENALLFLKGYLKEDYMVVSGDGKLDLGMLKVGDLAIIPDNSEILNYLTGVELRYMKVQEGLKGTPYLLKIVENALILNK